MLNNKLGSFSILPGCVIPSDCYGDNAPTLTCDDDARHCYDGNCICDRFPIGRR
mgnify:CR=1 FL=1